MYKNKSIKHLQQSIEIQRSHSTLGTHSEYDPVSNSTLNFWGGVPMVISPTNSPFKMRERSIDNNLGKAKTHSPQSKYLKVVSNHSYTYA